MRRPHFKAFTLVEMLVVIAIIGILMSMLLPALGIVRAKSRQSQCQANLHEIKIGRAGSSPLWIQRPHESI